MDINLEIEAVKQLGPFPKTQLDYLSEIFSVKDNLKTIPDFLLILHIKLLCQFHPDRVLAEVNSYSYPLDECMKLCKEYNVRDALSFFLERAGNLDQAVDIAFDVKFIFFSLKLSSCLEKH